jgi:predicted nucleic acid-binding protein
MPCIFDTNGVSELRRPRPHSGVAAWISTIERQELNVAGVTVGEIQTGVERTRERDAAKAAE